MALYSDKYAGRAMNDVNHGDCFSTHYEGESMPTATMYSDRNASALVISTIEQAASLSFMGASKPLSVPPHEKMEVEVMVESLSNALPAAVGPSNGMNVLVDDNSASRLSSSKFPSLNNNMQDHTIALDEAVSYFDGHGHKQCKNRRVGKKCSLSSSSSSCKCRPRRRNNSSYSNSVLPVLFMSFCSMSLATANLFTIEDVTSAFEAYSPALASAAAKVGEGYNVETTTNATTIFNGTTTTATSVISTTTTAGGLKLIDYVPPCKTLNKGQCQQNSPICSWNDYAACDYTHLPVTASSPPTTMNSRGPPSTITYSPTLETTTAPPVVVPTTASPVLGGPKSLSDSPTFKPTLNETFPPTPKPTTKSPTPKPSTRNPTPLPTVKPTTASPTQLPTMKPTTKSPTKAPTDWPTYTPTEEPSPRPTRKPTRKPTPVPTESPTLNPSPKPSPLPSMLPTSSPSVSPSASPSASPSDFPSATPTAYPTISPKPTPLVWPSASPTLSSSPTVSPSSAPSSSPTFAPSPVPTVAPVTAAPILVVVETPSPIFTVVSSSPSASSAKLQRVLIEKESTSITLKNAYKMSEGSRAYVAWEAITRDRIERNVQKMIYMKSGEMNVKVVAVIEDVNQRGEEGKGGRGRNRRLGVDSTHFRRHLQEGENGPSRPLRITFRTTLEFYSKLSDWDGSTLIASGFLKPSQQIEYISALQTKGQGSFGSVRSMAMSVNGQVITAVEENKNVTQDNTLTYIIAGAAAGVVVLFAIVGVYYVKRRNNRRNSGFANKKGVSGNYPDKSDFYKGNGNSGTMMSSPPNKSFPPSPPPQSSSPVGDYFGTIEPRPGEDDVSTLGDPYIGEVLANQALGGDNTVTESLMSSGNDMYVYGVTRPRMYTGDSSRMGGGSTINTGSNRMTFQDDGTLEDFYGTPDATNFHSEKDSNLTHITVVAQSGVLGIVIDNPTRTTPVVHAIKETSILNGRVHVGDLLMSVDEVDCRGMTAVAVSKLIGSRSQNPTRTLRLLRGATLADVHGDSSAYR